MWESPAHIWWCPCWAGGSRYHKKAGWESHKNKSVSSLASVPNSKFLYRVLALIPIVMEYDLIAVKWNKLSPSPSRYFWQYSKRTIIQTDFRFISPCLPSPLSKLNFMTYPIHCLLLSACLLHNSLIINLHTLVTVKIFLFQEPREMSSPCSSEELLPSALYLLLFMALLWDSRHLLTDLLIFLHMYQFIMSQASREKGPYPTYLWNLKTLNSMNKKIS